MKRYDRKVALKLINKYADECNRIEEEKNSLQLEVNDLRANIIVNKEIIDKLFNPNLSNDEKSKELILSLKKEINILTQRIEQLNKENSNLRLKVSSYEKIINSDIEEYRESTNELNDKIFILENENQKKENIIMSLNKQLYKMREKDAIDIKNEDEEGNEEENEEDSEEKVINSLPPNEIYIIDPSISVNLIQDDLMLYKKGYENALNKIREASGIIDKYENKIDELKSELYKYQKVSINKNNNIYNKNSLNEDLSLDTNDNSTFVFDEIINIPKIDNDNLENLCQNKNAVKLLIIINKYIKKLNEKINQLKKELFEMKNKLIIENSENMALYKTVIELKTKSSIYQSFSQRNIKPNFNDNYLNTDISLIENVDIPHKRKNKKKNTYSNNEEKLNLSAENNKKNLMKVYLEEINKNLTESK